MKIRESYRNRLQELSGIPIKPKDILMISEDGELNEIEIQDIEIPKKFLQDELNPALWKNGELDKEVRKQLLIIANEFIKELAISTEPQDIKIVGSNANYNYSESQGSDIDLHIFYSNEMSENENFAMEYLNAKVQLWRQNHTDITIKGCPVEIYVNLKDDSYIGGVYSLLKGKWETFPSKEKVIIDVHSLKIKIQSVAESIEELEQMKGHKTPKQIYEIATKLIDRIKKMRKCGLSKQGEFSIENLAFKYLRNTGYIKRLISIKTAAFNQKLSLD